MQVYELTYHDPTEDNGYRAVGLFTTRAAAEQRVLADAQSVGVPGPATIEQRDVEGEPTVWAIVDADGPFFTGPFPTHDEAVRYDDTDDVNDIVEMTIEEFIQRRVAAAVAHHTAGHLKLAELRAALSPARTEGP